jgi:hypothetical protein
MELGLLAAAAVMAVLMVANVFVVVGWEWGPRSPQFLRVQGGEIVRARAEEGTVRVPALVDRPRLYVGMGRWPVWEDQLRLTTWRFSMWPAAALSGFIGFVFWLLSRAMGRPR